MTTHEDATDADRPGGDNGQAGGARPPARRGAKLYLAGNLFGQLCGLLRYTLLARLLGPEQLGLVAALVLISNFFEMVTDTGSDRFLVQDRDGDEPAVQRLVQLVFVLRGATMATGLVLCAVPLSLFFGQPELALAIVVLAASPLIAGATHLDMRRSQRRNDFRPEGLAMLVAETLSLIATVVAAYLTHSFTAVLYGLIARSFVMVVVSHLTAKRRYGVGFDAASARRLRQFAVPLIGNGVLLFVVSQSDRLLVSRMVGIEALGIYSAVLLLVLYPTVALNRFFTGIHLPLLVGDEAGVRGGPGDLAAGRAVLLALAIAAGFAILAPLAVPLLFGEAFSTPAFLIAMIGVLQASRFVRVWPITHALAIGRSGIVLANSVARVGGIAAAIGGFYVIGGVPGIVAGLLLGEVAALATGLVMLNRARGLRPTLDFRRVANFLFGLALVLGLAAAAQARYLPGLWLLPLSVLFAVYLVICERTTLTDGLTAIRRTIHRGRR